ncbi:MAG: 3-deoxy-manno-octulosonate cytidylyltransferase, partial [Octadecabacter sp.]|nr:3-deoxy-manno-octulosonate cytidylyltransferase [Octadecabacter sp.]
MIWLHCGDVTQVPTVVSLVERLSGHKNRTRLLITAGPIRMFDGFDLPPSCTAIEVPADSPTKTRAFLDEM